MSSKIVFFFVILAWSLVILLVSCGDMEGQLSSISISPPTATVGVNKTQLFSANGRDSTGKIVSINPTWSAEGKIGTISSNGLFTAGSIEEIGKVEVTSGSLSAEATVTVTAKGWFEGRVSDELGKRVQGIEVYLKNTNLFDFTDSNGDYLISLIPAGNYEMWAHDPRGIYKDASQEAAMASGETVRNDFVIYYYSLPPDLTPPTL